MFSCRKDFLSSILACGLLILSSCASKKDSLNQKQANLYFGAGTQSLIDQKYTDALASLLKANELDPDNSQILNNLGMAYYFKGERDLAVTNLNQALKIDEKNSDARVNLASIYYKDGNYDQAEKIYKVVLQDLTYDKQARTLYNLGVMQLQVRKNMASAENYFLKSIKEDENYCPSHFQMGIIHYKQGSFNKALRNFKNASLGTCYESPASHYYQALTLTELHRYEDAHLKFAEIDT